MRGRRVVVGVDGSTPSREALGWASRLASAFGGEIVVVHALGLVEPLHGELVPAHRFRAEIEHVLEHEWCSTVRLRGRSLRVVVREGHPVDLLVDVARDEAAAVVVVGSRGVGAAPALALGSTSLHLLQVAPCPVLVVPAPHEATSTPCGAVRHILLGVDSQASTVAAVEMAGELAAAFGAKVTIVHAVEDVPVFPLGPETRASSEGEADAPERDRARLEPVRRQLQAMGLPAELRVERGVPSELVASAGTAIDADLVVVGSHHVGDPASSLLDSVSRQIARDSERPTLVVPEPT